LLRPPGGTASWPLLLPSLALPLLHAGNSASLAACAAAAAAVAHLLPSPLPPLAPPR